MSTLVSLVLVSLVATLLLLLHCVGALRRFLQAVSEYRRVRRLTARLPGPPPYPLLGNALEFSCALEDVHGRLLGMGKAYGPLYHLNVAHLTWVVVLDPHDMEVVLTSPQTADKSAVYGAIEPFVGSGLLALNGTPWRRHRKAITPSLHLDILRDFVHIFHKKGVAFTAKLTELADRGEVFDVTPLCGECANNSILETVMSTDIDADDPLKKLFLDLVPKALDIFMYRVWHPWFLSDWVFRLHRARYREYTAVKETANSFTKRIIQQRKEALRLDPRHHSKRVRQTFLDHVLSSEEGAALSEEDLVEEVKTIVTIASGSSMDLLSMFLYTLAIRHDVQDRMRQELDDILSEDRTRPVQHTDLPHMHYTECVVKEVMRFFSIVPIFARAVTEDITLPSGALLPRGCQVGFWLPYAHRSAKYFPRPDEFDPDRFLPENSRGRHPFAFVPFSAGPRNCIGQRYAMMFVKTVAATLVPRLRFEVPDDGPQRLDDIRLQMNLTVSVRGGANIRVRRR